jgi:hypothetical protein
VAMGPRVRACEGIECVAYGDGVMLVGLSISCGGGGHCPQSQGSAEVVGERVP